MRVGLICPYDLDLPGGVQDQVIRIAGWLEALGHRTTIVGPGKEGPPGAVLVGGSIVVKANRSAAPIAVDPRVAGRVRAAVEGCDVIHIHEPFMPAVSLAATRIRAIPSVGTFHADASPWARTALRVGGPLARVVAGRLDALTAVSDVARSAISAIDNVRVVPNAIDVGAYGGTPKNPGSVVFVGRDDPRKGLDVLLDAWPSVLEQVPGATLDVVGAERTDAIQGVTFHGRVDERAKRELLGGASVATAPNLGGESFGIVVLEAMASGCAVVASAIPAFAAVLGDAGELVKPGDSTGLSQKIVDLLMDPARAAALSAAARERSLRYDGEAIVERYLEIYAEAIALHR